jgi:hypothetical protein
MAGSIQEPCRLLGYGFTQLTRQGTESALALMLKSLTIALKHAGLEKCDLDGLIALPSLISDHHFMQVATHPPARNLGTRPLAGR